MENSKKWGIAALFIICVLAVAVNINLGHNITTTDDELVLRNAEALAQGEGYGFCYGTGDIECPSGQTYRVRVDR